MQIAASGCRMDEDEPFLRRDYSSWWRLPPTPPPGDAYYVGLSGLVIVLGLIALIVIGTELAAE
jgi:hypothetical protein